MNAWPANICMRIQASATQRMREARTGRLGGGLSRDLYITAIAEELVHACLRSSAAQRGLPSVYTRETGDVSIRFAQRAFFLTSRARKEAGQGLRQFPLPHGRGSLYSTRVRLTHLWRAAGFIPAVQRPCKPHRSTGINPVARCVNLSRVRYSTVIFSIACLSFRP
jgi:hypothetical protein